MWQGADALTSRADRVGTDDNQNADGCARGGSKNTHRDTDSISESDFCIIVVQNEDNDVFSLLEADLSISESRKECINVHRKGQLSSTLDIPQFKATKTIPRADGHGLHTVNGKVGGILDRLFFHAARPG